MPRRSLRSVRPYQLRIQPNRWTGEKPCPFCHRRLDPALDVEPDPRHRGQTRPDLVCRHCRKRLARHFGNFNDPDGPGPELGLTHEEADAVLRKLDRRY